MPVPADPPIVRVVHVTKEQAPTLPLCRLCHEPKERRDHPYVESGTWHCINETCWLSK